MRGDVTCFERRNLRASLRSATAVSAAVGLVLTSLAVAYFVSDISPLELLDDPAAATGASPLTGGLSVIGVLLWFSAATAALLAATLAQGEHRSLLIVIGAASIVLGVDDQFMVHEKLVPDALGGGELVIIVPYAALALLAAWRHGRTVLDHPDGVILLLSLGALGLSLAIDVSGEAFAGATAEESAKLLGISLWALFAIRAHLRSARDPGRGRLQGAPGGGEIADEPLRR